MGRILIFTGKGGVGKTSVAAAHARYSALEGKHTLLVSTDMAHNLGDIFETTIGREAVEVADHLDVLEIDPNYVMEHDFQDMKRGITDMITTAGLPLEDIETIAIFPGMDELFSLLKIMEIYRSGNYERIIIDCAPTGETLALLKFPELMAWYMEKFFPIEKIALRVLSPISKMVFKVQLPDKAAMSDMEKVYLKLMELQSLIKDRSITSIRLVSMPEKMVVEETKRNYMYMNLYDFNVDGIYINRILPKDMDNPFFDQWLDIQGGYIDELSMVFADIPIYKIPWFDCDISGIKGIDRIVEQVLVDKPIFDIIDKRVGERYEKDQDKYILRLPLPFLEKKDLNMHESNTDIIIKIGNFKRSIPKPGTLRGYKIASAKLDEDELKILFEKEA